MSSFDKLNLNLVKGQTLENLQGHATDERARLTLNSVNASEYPPLGFGEGIRSWRERSPPLSMRRDVLVEFCKARIARDMCDNL